jgi:hypothetical protein
MNANVLIESKMMVSAEFGVGAIPREPLVTIDRIAIEAQDKDGKEKWAVFFFREPWAKPLKMNRHSQKCCIAMFGTETDHWIGKRLALTAVAGVYFGERGTAVRIKGSPDLASPLSVSVKKRGSKQPDVYNLIPIGRTPSAPAPRDTSAPSPGHNPSPSAAPTSPATGQGAPSPAAAGDVSKPSSPAAATTAAGPCFTFGAHRGKPISTADDGALLETIGEAEKKLLEEPNASWAKGVNDWIGFFRTELEKRAMARMAAEQAREPGSDDGSVDDVLLL